MRELICCVLFSISILQASDSGYTVKDLIARVRVKSWEASIPLKRIIERMKLRKRKRQLDTHLEVYQRLDKARNNQPAIFKVNELPMKKDNRHNDYGGISSKFNCFLDGSDQESSEIFHCPYIHSVQPSKDSMCKVGGIALPRIRPILDSSRSDKSDSEYRLSDPRFPMLISEVACPLVESSKLKDFQEILSSSYIQESSFNSSPDEIDYDPYKCEWEGEIRVRTPDLPIIFEQLDEVESNSSEELNSSFKGIRISREFTYRKEMNNDLYPGEK